MTDPTPLGVPELDRALELLSNYGKPRRLKKWIWEIGRFPSLKGYLRVIDDSRQRIAIDMLDQARRAPDSVTDPRAGALVDLMRNGAPQFRGERVRGEEIDHEWYPPEVRPTINALLWAQRVRTASGGIY